MRYIYLTRKYNDFSANSRDDIGILDTWAIFWYAQFSNGGLCLVPQKRLLKI